MCGVKECQADKFDDALLYICNCCRKGKTGEKHLANTGRFLLLLLLLLLLLYIRVYAIMILELFSERPPKIYSRNKLPRFLDAKPTNES